MSQFFIFLSGKERILLFGLPTKCFLHIWNSGDSADYELHHLQGCLPSSMDDD